MTYRPARMKFGIFMAPFHRAFENPTRALQRDLELLEDLDRLGYDEAWIGEHHSAARETIADPALFIAAAAERTKRIRLGTGVTSLPYHHPFMVADKMVLLDHLTQGRAMLGVGPGVLASDAHMLGIDPVKQRAMMNESLDAIVRLLRGETVTMETEWFTLRDARLQLSSYTKPHLEIAVATTSTPSGPGAAGRHGASLLSVAGASHDTFSRTWEWVEEAAAEHGQTVSRDSWRVVTTIHLAETREQAIEDMRVGYRTRAYQGDRKNLERGLQIGGLAPTIEEEVEQNDHLIGTPDEVIRQIEEIQERSGGIGGILSMMHEWADPAATLKSYDLLARYVMPHFQGQIESLTDARDWFEDNLGEIFAKGGAGQVQAFKDAGKEMPPELAQALERAQSARERGGIDPRGVEQASRDG
jgi:limonene 1,2-monooxygenase